MISGTNPVTNSSYNSSYFFSNQSIIWGWATWKDRWESYHKTVKNANTILSDSKAKKNLLNKTTAKHLKTFDKVLRGNIDTWDYIWYFTNIIESRFCIIPTKNLISNVGFAVDATHTHIKTNQSNLQVTPMIFPLKHPDSFIVDIAFEKKYLSQVKLLHLFLSIARAHFS